MEALGKILSLDNLRKRNTIVVDWCCICKRNGETIDHLLLHYGVTRELWVLTFFLLGVEWVMPRRVIELLVSWRGQLGSCNIEESWRMMPCV